MILLLQDESHLQKDKLLREHLLMAQREKKLQQQVVQAESEMQAIRKCQDIGEQERDKALAEVMADSFNNI